MQMAAAIRARAGAAEVSDAAPPAVERASDALAFPHFPHSTPEAAAQVRWLVMAQYAFWRRKKVWIMIWKSSQRFQFSR